MATDDRPSAARAGEIHGWKEIASYLNRSVRTAQRWESELRLPVRRIPTAQGDTVYALQAELDEWKKNITLKEAAPGSDEAEAEAGAATGRQSATGRPRSRVWIVAGCVALAGSLVGGGLWAWRATGSSAARLAFGGSRPATSRTSVLSVVDPGPWPTNGHDMQRTNRSHLRGPGNPGTPRLLHHLTGDLDLLTEVVSAMDGRIMFGACGRVIAIDRNGRTLWTRELRTQTGQAAHPSGFSVDAGGLAYLTTCECPNTPDAVQNHLYAIAGSGDLDVISPIGAVFAPGPAIGLNQSIYTIDEINFLRGFRPWKAHVFGTTLAGFLSGGITVDPNGNLLIGTNGGTTHQHSLWSIAPDGHVRWRALTAPLGQVVASEDRLHVASQTGEVYAFSLDGAEIWSVQVGGIASLQPLALGRSGTVYVQTSNEVVALRPDGSVKWRFGSAASLAGLRARPLLDTDENVYAALGHEVVSITPEGRERWRVPMSRPWTIIIGEDRVLYVTTGDNKLYAIGEA